jgi:peptidoglycan/xylan/chitin deacetylase (PgdA/CDA1 family)
MISASRLSASVLFRARRLSCVIPERRIELADREAYVSFTFDDFPASALDVGGSILERYGAVGTFYWSGGLSSTAPDGERDKVRATIDRGHELGCHTYSHIDCALADAGDLTVELDRNRAAFQSIIPGYEAQNFAYPYGAVNPGARRLVSKRFHTARGIYGGINRKVFDAGLLKANKLYGNDAVYRTALALIDQVASCGGWLIFFTHDVSDSPSEYGAHAAAFENVVRSAVAAGCVVASIGFVADAALARTGKAP